MSYEKLHEKMVKITEETKEPKKGKDKILPLPSGGYKIYMFSKLVDGFGNINTRKFEMDENYLLTILDPSFDEGKADWLDDEEEYEKYNDIANSISSSDMSSEDVIQRLKKGELPVEIIHEEGGIGIAFTKKEAVTAAQNAFRAGEEPEEDWKD